MLLKSPQAIAFLSQQPNCLQSNQSILKEISPEYSGLTDAEAETPVLRPPDTKSWLIGKDPDAGEDWKQEEKGTTEDKMVGWHHQLNGHGLIKLWEMVKDREAGHDAVHGAAELGMTEWRNHHQLKLIN